MAKIAVGGINCKSNSLSTDVTEYEGCNLYTGNNLLQQVANINNPLAGFQQQAAEQYQFTIVPSLWCQTNHNGPLSHDAFERIAASLCYEISNAMPLEGVYLDLTGTMLSTQIENPENDLLKQIRSIIGPATPLIVSVSLQANISRQMMELASVIVVGNCLPATDNLDTGKRAALLLDQLINTPEKFKYKSLKKVPCNILPEWQFTDNPPVQKIFQQLATLQSDEICLFFTQGYPFSNAEEIGPCILAYSNSYQTAIEAVEQLEATIVQQNFNIETWNQPDAVAHAIKQTSGRKKQNTIVLADIKDDPDDGCSSDVVELLKELIKQNAKHTLVAAICDPESVKIANNAGANAEVKLLLGGKSDCPNQSPTSNNFMVKHLHDGKIPANGALYHGQELDLGLTAVLEINGIDIVVTSNKIEPVEPAIFEQLNIDFASKKIIALKSSFNFRVLFDDKVNIILVNGPGLSAIYTPPE